MILNFHRCNVTNMGDLLCAPSLYFDFGQKARTFDVCEDPRKLSYITLSNRLRFQKNHILLGGGGFFHHGYFDAGLQRLLDQRVSSFVIWGAGYNQHTGDAYANARLSQALFDKADLVGLRDHIPGVRYVPCASCMNSYLHQTYAILNDIVVYEHEQMPLTHPSLAALPRIRNNRPQAREIFSFLGSARYVITNSYHGMYWSILLNRKVLVIPYASKFDLSPFDVPFCTPEDWAEKLDLCQTYPQALEESRALTVAFYENYRRVLAG